MLVHCSVNRKRFYSREMEVNEFVTAIAPHRTTFPPFIFALEIAGSETLYQRSTTTNRRKRSKKFSGKIWDPPCVSFACRQARRGFFSCWKAHKSPSRAINNPKRESHRSRYDYPSRLNRHLGLFTEYVTLCQQRENV